MSENCLLIFPGLATMSKSTPIYFQVGIDDRWNLWCFPDTFVALTDFQLYWARKANPFVSVVKIPNGIDPAVFNSQVTPLKINISRPIILIVAAFTPAKRLDLAIRAVAKLKRGSLLLVGDGDQKDYLIQLGNQLLGRRFAALKLPYSQVPQIYPAADLFTFPTVPYESFGIVLLEAMASGLPVVATADPIRAEIVGDSGLFVDPTDTETYAATLKHALNTSWGKKPLIQAQKFTWGKIASDYDRLFRKLCSQ
ncbi:MAG: Glycosyl transferase group 1 [Candidatus Amesbacteria bacterium GW2011_GWA2_47_11]|uniref:Glycosyl transferase group 1 n=1 Tax=Candidatus Amesbacteria bacterium GW2011_GWA2_47_11 TaxID=1618357 RepID=A0A0G1RHW3_9BACT|nr:MAG: Glycosyl transferase group 1 [Candidatus Amesbacteria bacterium GW2011_GWA2_47_11]